MERTIIHLNVADFAVGVEREVDVRLKGRPVIIAPRGVPRAAVYDMSEEAYRAGVRKGMTLRRAMHCCGDARILPPRPDRYERALRALLRQAQPYSPLVEMPDGAGHLFIDVTGGHRLFGPPVDVAWRLHRSIKNDLGLDPIWSVAPNKLVAKVATRLVKPSGEYIVGAGDEESFLAPLPVRLVPGIERSDLRRLQEFNITRVCQVTALSLAHLTVPFGTRARFIYEAVRGIDRSPVLPVGQKPPEISADHEFGNGTNHKPTLESVLYRLVEQVGSELRQRQKATRRIRIILDYADGMRHVRQAAVRSPTANDLTLFELAGPTFLRAWTRRIRLRHMRLTCDRLVSPPTQLELFAESRNESAKRAGLVAAMDSIRHRFGANAIRMGRTI